MARFFDETKVTGMPVIKKGGMLRAKVVLIFNNAAFLIINIIRLIHHTARGPIAGLAFGNIFISLHSVSPEFIIPTEANCLALRINSSKPQKVPFRTNQICRKNKTYKQLFGFWHLP